MSRIKISQEDYDNFARRGLVPIHKGKSKKKDLLFQAGHDPSRCLWVIPLRIASNDNASWSKRKSLIGRAGHERRVCSAIFALSHSRFATLVDWLKSEFGSLEIVLTKLGGHEMDYSNLVAAFKWIQDTVCLWLGVDDRDKRLKWVYNQDCVGAIHHGVRVVIVESGHQFRGEPK